MNNANKMISVGGWSLVIFTLLYLGVQAYLVSFYNYPTSVYDPGLRLLPILLAGSHSLAVMLTIFSLTPLLLIIGSVGAYYAFKDINEPAMRLSTYFAIIMALAFTLYLMRWPSFGLTLSGAYALADPLQRGVLAALYHAENSYYGVFLGGFLTSVCGGVWSLIVGLVMLQTKGFPRWMGYLGIIAAIYMFVQIFNAFGFYPPMVTMILTRFAPIDAVWLLFFGVGLLAYRRS
jgi:hypothetical protein